MIPELISVVATIFGALMSLSGIPQILRIRKRKSSNDVAISMVTIFLVGVTVWFIYGIIYNNYPILITNGLGIAVWSATLATVMRYRK